MNRQLYKVFTTKANKNGASHSYVDNKEDAKALRTYWQSLEWIKVMIRKT